MLSSALLRPLKTQFSNITVVPHAQGTPLKNGVLINCLGVDNMEHIIYNAYVLEKRLEIQEKWVFGIPGALFVKKS